MPRMRIERVDCTACQYFGKEGISDRCILKENMYNNWLGVMYHQTPSHRNYNGKCPDYKEKTNGK